MEKARERVREYRLIIIAAGLAVISFAIAYAYFSKAVSYDVYSWLFWAGTIILLIIFAAKKDLSAPRDSGDKPKHEWMKLLLLLCWLTILYFFIRYMNYSTSPWNQNGYYDDAAWDVYYMRRHAEGALPTVQVVMYDHFVIGNVRELLFAWYLIPFFRLLGYNALILNFACAVLGYAAAVFTGLTAKRLSGSYLMAFLAGMLLTLNPYHFAHTYMAERYAMAPTMMIISVYFITCALQDRSALKGFLGGVFAALCAGSGKTGKVYVYCIIAAAALYVMFNFKTLLKIRTMSGIKDLLRFPSWLALGFLAGFIPYFAFIAVYPDVYNSRESGLIGEFFTNLKDNGFSYLYSRTALLFESVFSPNAAGKQYTGGYPLISKWHGLLVIGGTVLAFIRKRYDIFAVCVLPAAALAVVPFYDYRLYISTPVWVLAVIYFIDAVFKHKIDFGNNTTYIRLAAVCVTFIMLAAGVATGFSYMARTTGNPLSQYLNRRNDVGAMRIMQDVIMGENKPSAQIKRNEFKRPDIPVPLPKNYFIAPESAFGVAALYMADFPEESVSYLAGEVFYNGYEVQELIDKTKEKFQNFTDYSKDLCIIIEEGGKIQPVLEAVKSAGDYGAAYNINENLDGVSLSIYVMDVPKENIEQFKSVVLERLE